jgi:transposase-like protein
MVRKLRDFLKDETATAAFEYGLVAAGLAVVMITAVRPANPSPACPTCGLPMRLVTTIPKFTLHPELRTYKCRKCEKTTIVEWEPGKRGSTLQRFVATPILMYLAFNRQRDRIVGLEPMIDTAGPIGRGSSLRNYALAAECTPAPVDKRGRNREMSIKWNAGIRVVNQFLDDALSFLDRFAAKILSIDLKKIERAEPDLMIMLPPPDHFKHCKAALIAGYGIACGVRGFFAWFAKDVIRRCRSVIKICPHACHRGLQRVVAAVAFCSSIMFMAITFPIRLAARILIVVLPQA